MNQNEGKVTSNVSVEDSVRVWQCEELLCGTALHAVFAWLAPEELARAGAACRAWRRAAAEPALWRRHLLRAGAAPAALHALKQHDESVSWRQEYVTACAGWRHECTWLENTKNVLRMVSLSPNGRFIAASGHYYLIVWEFCNSKWCERWRIEMEPLGLNLIFRLDWNSDASHLMGFAALIHPDWETDLFIFQGNDEGEVKGGSIIARVINITEACWNTCYSFITFVSTHRVFDIPHPGCSVSWANVYLYSYLEESESEYVETKQLLRIYDENDDLSRQISTNGFVIDVPKNFETSCDDIDIDYLRATENSEITSSDESTRVLVANFGTWIRTWLLETLPIPDPDLDDYENLVRVRAACTEPAYEVRLPSQPYQLTPHPNKRCAWIATCDGFVTCVSLPTLQILRVLTSPDGFDLHNCCLHSSVARKYIACSNGDTVWPRSNVRTWCTRTGVSGPIIATYELQTMRPFSDDQLMLLTNSGLEMYRSRATPQPTLQDLDSPETTSPEI